MIAPKDGSGAGHRAAARTTLHRGTPVGLDEGGFRLLARRLPGSPRRRSRPLARRREEDRPEAEPGSGPEASRARDAAPAAPAPPPAVPSAIGMTVHHLDFTTHDLDAVRNFYVDLLGFKNFDHDPQFNYLWVQTGGTSSLGFMPPMQGMGETSPPRADALLHRRRRGSRVRDAERARRDVRRASRGHAVGPPRRSNHRPRRPAGHARHAQADLIAGSRSHP